MYWYFYLLKSMCAHELQYNQKQKQNGVPTQINMFISGGFELFNNYFCSCFCSCCCGHVGVFHSAKILSNSPLEARTTRSVDWYPISWTPFKSWSMVLFAKSSTRTPLPCNSDGKFGVSTTGGMISTTSTCESFICCLRLRVKECKPAAEHKLHHFRSCDHDVWYLWQQSTMDNELRDRIRRCRSHWQ